jgi:hypothetical protein
MEVPAARHNSGAYGKLPVMEEVRREAERRGIKLLILPTLGAIDALNRDIGPNQRSVARDLLGQCIVPPDRMKSARES